jgi:hypothetical protein
MEEVLNSGVADTNLQPETAAPQTEANQQNVAPETVETPKVESDQQDKGWIRKVRRDRDEAIRKAEEAERREKMKDELIKQLMAHQPQNQEAEEDILSEIQKTEYVEGEKVAKALKKQKQDFEAQLAELKKMQERTFVAKQEEQIRSQFQDFDDVVNADTLDMLKETNPKLFSRVANLLKVDPMDGAVFAYETIIASGVAEQIPGIRRKKEVEKKLEQNKKTVQSPIAHDNRPIAQAMSYAEAKKARDALWAETNRYASMAGMGY